MDLGLRGKVAIITGGSRGIGRAIALGLADEGCDVAISARGEEGLGKTVEEIRAKGVRALGVAGDMTQVADVERLVRAAVEGLGGVDVLVNNVGGARGGRLQDSTDEDFLGAHAVNFMAAVRASRLVIPEMRRRGGGRIISLSSIWGREAGGTAPYNAAKAAEISLSKALAKELAPDGILVNTVAPGSTLFPGGGWERRRNADPDGMAEFVRREMPLGRFGRPEEVAAVVVFLASERASLVTGACIPVDGCQTRSNI
jgi:3-oxoacyl-[acyl-carrier protein] reductase